MAFICKDQVPKHKIPTYVHFASDIRPHKAETYCSRLTVGGNLIEYLGDKSCTTADLTSFKCLINPTISSNKARFCTTHINKFYLGTPLAEYEYMKLKLEMTPDKIISQYNLRAIADYGWYIVK